MKILMLISLIFLSGCVHYKCHDGVNCHLSQKKIPKILQENPVEIRGAVYVDEQY
jgi:hypothetical protein